MLKKESIFFLKKICLPEPKCGHKHVNVKSSNKLTFLMLSGKVSPLVFIILGNRNYLQSLIIFTNPSVQAGYDIRSIFKRSLTGLNSEFSFS